MRNHRAFTATGPSARVRFGVEDLTPAGTDRFGPSGILVDDASLVAVNAAVVPEPRTWALLATGLATVGGVATRRTRRRSRAA